MLDEELQAWLRLALTPGIGPQTARKLLAAFGLPQHIFESSYAALRQVVSEAQARALQQKPEELAAQLEAHQAWLKQATPSIRRRIYTLSDTDYPATLLNMPDPPMMLYTMGHLDLATLAHTPTLSIVGSRHPTPQGLSDAKQFAKNLSQNGFCIISGLAQGIDGQAHEGALEGKGSTIAIVGTGIDRVYPKEHLDLARRIAERGLIMSEFLLGTPPVARHFPKRNRIIATLGLGTLVVEASLPSGSLITAQLAASSGREVLAIPGSIHSPQSKGCHALIKQGAQLVESAEDILQALARVMPNLTHPVHPTASDPDPDDSLDPLLQALGFNPVSLESLIARTSLEAAYLQARLLELELSGQIARLPGGLVQRLAQV